MNAAVRSLVVWISRENARVEFGIAVSAVVPDRDDLVVIIIRAEL